MGPQEERLAAAQEEQGDRRKGCDNTSTQTHAHRYSSCCRRRRRRQRALPLNADAVDVDVVVVDVDFVDHRHSTSGAQVSRQTRRAQRHTPNTKTHAIQCAALLLWPLALLCTRATARGDNEIVVQAARAQRQHQGKCEASEDLCVCVCFVYLHAVDSSAMTSANLRLGRLRARTTCQRICIHLNPIIGEGPRARARVRHRFVRVAPKLMTP